MIRINNWFFGFSEWRSILAVVLPSVLVVLAIWVPFGFTLSGLIEEWDVLGLFASHGLFFIANIDSPFAAHALRPLTVFPHALAFYFDPNSFNYWHLLLIFTLIVKGCASSHLVWKATGSLGWGAAMGVLVLVYPADTMQLSFRGLHINFALAMLMFASSLFVIACDQTRSIKAYCLMTVAAALLFAACSMYEASLILSPLPLFVTFIRGGGQRLLHQVRTQWGLLFVWIGGAGGYICYVVTVAPKVASYQSSITAGSTISTLARSFPKLFSIGALRSLIGGWFDAVRMVSTEFSDYTYIIIAVAALSAFVFYIAKGCGRSLQDTCDLHELRWLPCRLATSGVFLMLLGYSPFLILPSHLAISQRTFLWATPGAAMVWIALLIIIFRSARWLAVVFLLLLAFFGLGAQLFQLHHYENISRTQRALLASIVWNFDGKLEDKTLLVLDGTSQLGHTWMLSSGNLAHALSYLYDLPIRTLEVCHTPSNEWQHTDDLNRKGTCFEQGGGWVFRLPPPVSGPGYVPGPSANDTSKEKGKVVQVSINADGSVSPDLALDGYRRELLHGGSTVAQRYRGVLVGAAWPLALLKFRDQEQKSRYRWDFGDWWSMELPIRGSGWREAEWNVRSFFHQAFSWKANEKSSLSFDLSPTQDKYVVRGKFDTIVSDPIANSLRIHVNSKGVVYRWLADGEFEGEVDSAVLVSGTNEIEFISDVDPKYFGFSAKLDWVEVEPGSASTSQR